jgi:hypothetical protein
MPGRVGEISPIILTTPEKGVEKARKVVTLFTAVDLLAAQTGVKRARRLQLVFAVLTAPLVVGYLQFLTGVEGPSFR